MGCIEISPFALQLNGVVSIGMYLNEWKCGPRSKIMRQGAKCGVPITKHTYIGNKRRFEFLVFEPVPVKVLEPSLLLEFFEALAIGFAPKSSCGVSFQQLNNVLDGLAARIGRYETHPH